ncbi:hypothetical protein C8R48DRAFT_740264 [Suillus tomentosus]|nr:hypothetical protein C8R48DRAFT_740264 [Suillus tomentosus]
MRLSSFAVPILSVSTTFALSKLPHPHRPHRRALMQDICGSLNSDLVLNEVIDSYGNPTVAGHIEACLCLSDVGKFVESNAVAQQAVELLYDESKVEALISDMVTGLPTASHCSYPDHARALCTDSNPCDFECADGYLAFPSERPTSCKCPDNFMECDGKCGPFTVCPSKAPPSRRDNEPQCAAGRTMCGVPGTSTGQPWKCVDITTDPTTCGGCVEACPFGHAPVTGVNCTDIKGVIPDTVSCGNGRCIVKDCAEGFVVSSASDTCIPVSDRVTAGSEQQSGAAIPGSSASTGSTESFKSSRREVTVPKHGAGSAIAPVGGLKARDVIGDIQHGTGIVHRATERLTPGGSASPAGVQGTKGVSPASGSVEGTSDGFKATRNVGLAHDAGVMPVGARNLAVDHMGAFTGTHEVCDVDADLIPVAGTC